MLSQEIDHLAVKWGSGVTSKYHWIWLRDSCPCAACLNENAKQKYNDPATIPLDIKPDDVEEDRNHIRIKWPDGHQSHYEKAWLSDNDYSRVNLHEEPTTRHQWRPWDSQDIVRNSIFHIALNSEESVYKPILTYLLQYGMVILKTKGPTEEVFGDLCKKLAGFVDRSYFGEFFDLETKPEEATDSVSFSTKALPLHTDIPYYTTPPDYQFLFGLEVSKQPSNQPVGRTQFIDGYAVARNFRTTSPDDFALLASTRVTYRARYPSANKFYKNQTEIIKLDADGHIVRLLNNPSKMFFDSVSFKSMLPLYRAYKAFKEALANAEVSHFHAWEQGDMVVFDNRRIFHGREAFDNPGVTRKLRGGYFREVELLARCAYLS